MKLKSKCCEKYLKKGKACHDCPLMAGLSKQHRRKKLRKLKKKRR